MKFSEDDIDFLSLSDGKFEEICFELLLQLGYRGLIWRQGGADNGRDIEGYLETSNPLVGEIREKWFFECKRYKAGLPPDEMNSKIAWADAEKPQHLVILISSYLSNNARTWLEKTAIGKPYVIHVIEGKQLKDLLLNCPEIIEKFFLTQYQKMLVEAQKNWLLLGIEPEFNTISALSRHLNFSKLTASELAFFWNFVHVVLSELDEDRALEKGPISLYSAYNALTSFSNYNEPVLSQEDNFSVKESTMGTNIWETTDIQYGITKLSVNTKTNPVTAIYSFVYNFDGEGLEVLLKASSNLPTRIRHLKTDAKNEIMKTLESFVASQMAKYQKNSRSNLYGEKNDNTY